MLYLPTLLQPSGARGKAKTGEADQSVSNAHRDKRSYPTPPFATLDYFSSFTYTHTGPKGPDRRPSPIHRVKATSPNAKRGAQAKEGSYRVVVNAREKERTHAQGFDSKPVPFHLFPRPTGSSHTPAQQALHTRRPAGLTTKNTWGKDTI